MVDFSTLGKLDPATIAAREAESRERMYVGDEAKRDAATKKALTITLSHEPEGRTKPSGERVILLRGVEEGRTQPLTAVYTVPMRTSHDEDREARFDQTLRGLGGGDRVSLGGQWAKRGWNDAAGIRHEAWEFKTQVFEKGDVPLERMLENERASRRGEAVAQGAPSREAAEPARSTRRGPSPDAGVGR